MDNAIPMQHQVTPKQTQIKTNEKGDEMSINIDFDRLESIELGKERIFV